MRSATSVEARYKRAHLSAIRFEGLPAQDRRYGPFSAQADPNHSKSSHTSAVRSIVPDPKQASVDKILSPWTGAVRSNGHSDPQRPSDVQVVSRAPEPEVGKGSQLMIPTLACSVELITVVDEPVLEPTTVTAKAMPNRRQRGRAVGSAPS